MTSAALADLAWGRLRAEPQRTFVDLGIPSFPLRIVTRAGNVRLALGQEGEARLLLPLSAGEPFPKIAEARGLTLTDSVFMLEGRPRRFIDLVCKSRELEEVFRDLVVEILSRIDAKEAPAQAVEGSIKDFRSLLLGPWTQNISVQSAVGMLGELVLLERLLQIDGEAWKAWTGPLSGRHDFRAGPHAIEVKASIRSQRKSVQISALDQLAEPPGGKLVLFHHVFEEDAGGDLTIPALAAKILGRSSDSEAVAALLDSAGYDAQFDKQWDEFCFSALQEDAYRVGPGFPRLVPSDFDKGELPAGVSHFRYTVDLSAASQFLLREDEFNEYLAGVVSCLNQS
jgi:hypothetical protein